jgi:hypothetical protein
MDVIRLPGFHFHSHMSIRRSEPYGPTPGLGRTWKTGRPLRLLTSGCCKELAQQTTHLQNPSDRDYNPLFRSLFVAYSVTSQKLRPARVLEIVLE